MLNATELHIDNPCAAPCSPNVSPKQCSVRIQESHHPPAPVQRRADLVGRAELGDVLPVAVQA